MYFSSRLMISAISLNFQKSARKNINFGSLVTTVFLTMSNSIDRRKRGGGKYKSLKCLPSEVKSCTFFAEQAVVFHFLLLALPSLEERRPEAVGGSLDKLNLNFNSTFKDKQILPVSLSTPQQFVFL